MAYHKEVEKKELNAAEVVKYLSRSFNRAISNSPLSSQKALRVVNKRVDPTELYLLQVDFCYLIDHITRGPSYIAPKYIQEANELITEIESAQ